MGRATATSTHGPNAKKTAPTTPTAPPRPTPDDDDVSARKRALGKGLHILPPSETDLNGNLKFAKKRDQNRYKLVRTQSIVPGKCLHEPTLATLNLATKVHELIEHIAWQPYFAITCPAYIELVREFYTTFEFKKPDNFTLSSPRVVQFRLMGKEFKLSITGFNLAFGFITKEYAKTEEYLNSSCDYSEDFEPYGLYGDLSTNHMYDPSKSKDTFLRDPALIYIHRLLAFNFSDRKDSARVLTKCEFYFLWCMLKKKKVNLRYWLASQFDNVVTAKRPLILGSLITHLAVHEKLIDLHNNNLHIACEIQPLDLHCLEKMGLVSKFAGKYEFETPGAIHRGPKPRPTKRAAKARTWASPNPPSPSLAIVSYREHADDCENDNDRIARIEKNLNAFFAHMGFVPPSP